MVLTLSQPSQQLSQIEKSVTHLLIATKQLLETLTQWSRHNATEGEVSDVYVRLGYEFNIACRAFTAIGVDTSDLGPVPDLLRAILEDTLSQEASPASLDRFLPRIRDIIINLLHGLKKKQQRLRQRQARENPASGSNQTTRQLSLNSTGSAETGLTQMLDDVPTTNTASRSSNRIPEGGPPPPYSEDIGVPPRTSSVQNGITSPIKETTVNYLEMPNPPDDGQSSIRTTSGSSLSSTTAQDLPVLTPDRYEVPPQQPMPSYTQYPPPPPPKQQDALAALQKGGDLERRASRRYSQYQIQKHLGASASGVPMLPPSQNTPIPNRGREVRDSMNAVRVRGSMLPSRQRSNRLQDQTSPGKSNVMNRRISEEGSQNGDQPAAASVPKTGTEEVPAIKVADGQTKAVGDQAVREPQPGLGATLNGPTTTNEYELPEYDTSRGEEVMSVRKGSGSTTIRKDGSSSAGEMLLAGGTGAQAEEQFIPEQSPQPGKELTLFLQYKTKIKKFVLPEGLSELSMARLQLAFIEKFAWNTHSNGIDLPEIYIQDPVSGVRHELEDLSDVKDRSVLVLNIEVLDEVKKHIDEGLGGLRKVIEGIRTSVDTQQTSLQQVAERQEESAKDVARLAATPPASATRPSQALTNGVRTSPAETSHHLSSIQALRRDLAVVRQTHASFAASLGTSMNEIRAKAATIKTTAVATALPTFDSSSGRAYLTNGKKAVGETSEGIVNRVDDLQDMVEDLRKDVVSRGVRPLPRQLEVVGKDISIATKELKKMQEYLKREKPLWTKIWEKELEMVCNDREFLTMQEELVADLEDDLEKANQTFALVEQATKQQNLHAAPGSQGSGPGGVGGITLRSTSRGNMVNDGADLDPRKAKDGVLGEVKALQPNHESRLEAIERAEKLRQRELEGRKDGAFQKELGSFVEEGRLRKSGGVEEVDRVRKARDERNRLKAFENQVAREKAKEKEAAEGASENADATTMGEGGNGGRDGGGEGQVPEERTASPVDEGEHDVTS